MEILRLTLWYSDDKYDGQRFEYCCLHDQYAPTIPCQPVTFIAIVQPLKTKLGKDSRNLFQYTWTYFISQNKKKSFLKIVISDPATPWNHDTEKLLQFLQREALNERNIWNQSGA